MTESYKKNLGVLAHLLSPETPNSVLDILERVMNMQLPELQDYATNLKNELSSEQDQTAKLIQENTAALQDQKKVVELLKHNISDSEQSLELALESQSNFSTALETFQSRIAEIAEDRNAPRLILKLKNQIMSLCELPLLALTFSRTNHHSDSQLLLSHLARLHRRYPELAILKRLKVQGEKVQEEQKRRLLGQLKGKLTMAAFLGIVGYLRQTGRFEESDLALVVFRARIQYINSVWKEEIIVTETMQLNAAHSSFHKGEKELKIHLDLLKKLRAAVEIWRDRVYEVVRQLKAGFPTESKLLQDLGISIVYKAVEEYREVLVTRTGSLLSDEKLFVLKDFEKEESKQRKPDSTPRDVDDIAFFSSWDAIASALAAIHTQAGQTGISITVLGLEWQACLAPVFSECIHNIVVLGHLSRGLHLLVFDLENVENFIMQGKDLSIVWPGWKDDLDEQASFSSELILRHPPIARFSNHILGALNLLRLIAAVQLALPLAIEFSRFCREARLLLDSTFTQLKDSNTHVLIDKVWILTEKWLRDDCYKKIYAKVINNTLLTDWCVNEALPNNISTLQTY